MAIVCIGLMAIDCWNSLQSRTLHLQQMSVATANLARAMAQQADDQIKLADTVLVDIVERIESEGTGPAEVARLREFLTLRIAELQQLDGLHIYDEDGNWIANSRQTWPENLSNAGREYFLFHRTSTDRGPHIDVPVKSRINGKLLVPISRRISRSDGSFAGVALATIKVDFFVKFYESLDIGQDGALALILDNGITITRRPYTSGVVGRDMRGSDLFHAYVAKGPIGTAYIKSTQDGVLRLNSFQRLNNYPLFVAASLSKAEILSDWWRDTLWHSAGVMFFALIVSVIGWRLVKQFRLQTQTEAELRQTQDALESLNSVLNKHAMEDALTGLANRRKFDETLDAEFRRSVRDASTLALIMIDVDCFKQYNDLYGHAAGDDCLQVIGRTISAISSRRPGDLAARYGGEELAVLLPNTDLAGAVAVAERIRNAVADLRIDHAGVAAGFVTLSAGVEALKTLPLIGQPRDLIAAADKALYRAKAEGRDRVCSRPGSCG